MIAGHRRPDDLEPRVAVDRRARRALLARAHPESRTEKRTTTVTRTKIGTEQMIRTSQSVSIFLACVEAGGGNQSMTSPSAMPMADAIDADDDHLR